MPPKLSDYVSAAEAFVVFEEEFEGTLLPIASNSFEGAGVHDEDLAMSRPATPLDLQSIAPPSNWDDFGRVVGEIWEGIEVYDVVLNQLKANWLQMRSIATSPLIFKAAADEACLKYIKAQIDGYIDLMKVLIPTLLDFQQCQFNILFYSQAELIGVLLSDDGKAKLEQAKSQLLQHVLTDEKCRILIGIADAMISLHEAWIWFKQTPLSEIWEEIGHVATIMAELLRRVEIQETILKVSADPEKLGKIYGTLVGFIVWEVVEAIATRGLSKGVKFLKVVV